MKKLPVNMQPFTGTRCPISLPASILETTQFGCDWIASHMNLFLQYNNQLYFGDGKNEYGIQRFRELWEDESVNIFNYTEDEIISMIKQRIDLGEYAVMDVAEPVIWGESNFRTHEHLIYGYDDQEGGLFLLYLDQKNMSLGKNTQKEVFCSYETFKESIIYVKKFFSKHRNQRFSREQNFFACLTFIRLKKPGSSFYLAQMALSKIKEEFEGAAITYRYHNREMHGFQDRQVFQGLAILIRFTTALNWAINWNDDVLRASHLNFMALYESRLLMLRAFGLIEREFKVAGAEWYKNIALYQESAKLLETNYYLRLKYMKKKEKDIALLERIKANLIKSYELEYDSLRALYEIGHKAGVEEMTRLSNIKKEDAKHDKNN